MGEINVCRNKSGKYCMGSQQHCEGKKCGNYIGIKEKYKDNLDWQIEQKIKSAHEEIKNEINLHLEQLANEGKQGKLAWNILKEIKEKK